jgi:hypothetical protein
MRRACAIEGTGLCDEFIGPLREMRCSPASKRSNSRLATETRPNRDKLFTIFRGWWFSRRDGAALPTTRIN